MRRASKQILGNLRITSQIYDATPMIDFIFHQCVRLLEWSARKLGTTYNAINVWIFCVIWPAI